MGDVFQRNSMALGAPQIAPISLGQFGVPRPDLSMTSPMNTAGGLGIPNLGTPGTPAQNFLSPAEIAALGGSGGRGKVPDFGGYIFDTGMMDGNIAGHFSGGVQDPMLSFTNTMQQMQRSPRLIR